MTLPAEREQWPESQEDGHVEPVFEPMGEVPPPHTSPANHLLSILQSANLGQLRRKITSGPSRRVEFREAEIERVPPLLKNFGTVLLAWSIGAMVLSIGILAFEILEPSAPVVTERPPLEFEEMASRHVESSEGRALELTGLVRNAGERPVQPEVTLQLAGSRVAIEEPLRLGAAALPPGAERPFTVRLLLPEGTKTVRLLPAENTRAPKGSMPLVSPAWTSETSL